MGSRVKRTRPRSNRAVAKPRRTAVLARQVGPMITAHRHLRLRRGRTVISGHSRQTAAVPQAGPLAIARHHRRLRDWTMLSARRRHRPDDNAHDHCLAPPMDGR